MNNKRMHILIINRWDDEFSQYHNYIDHQLHKVSYICSVAGVTRLDEKLAQKIVEVENFTDCNALVNSAKQIESEVGTIDIVIALSEFDLDNAAVVRESLGAQGYDVETTKRFRDKVIMKKAILEFGLRAPRYIHASADEQELEDFLTTIKFPLILKPRKGAASEGCHKVDDYNTLQQLLKSVDRASFEIEEFVSGQIFHVDGLVKDGQILFSKCSKYLNTCLEFLSGKPLGSILLQCDDLNKRLRDFTKQSLEVLSLDQGAFHLEIIEQNNELFFLEIGARVGGAEVPFVMFDLFGVDMIKCWLDILLDQPLVIDKEKSEANLSGGWLIFPEPPQGKTFVSATSMEPSIDSIYAEEFPESGFEFDGNGGYRGLPGRFRFKSNDIESVTKDMLKTMQHFKIELV